MSTPSDNSEKSLSVHQFIELTAREGDLEGGFFSNQRAVDGTKAHKKVQARRPIRYEKEKKVERTFTKAKHALKIEGRIDGVFLTDPLEIEEIKSVEREYPGSWENSPVLHRAQLLVYGGLYRVEPEVQIKLTLTYYHLRSEKEESYSRFMTGSELSVYLDDLLDAYFAEQEKRQKWVEGRNRSCKELTFPYGEFRLGQRDLSAQVYRAIRDEEILMAQAPTGTGKTMGTLFPAVKALGEGELDRIVYLTARTPGRTLAAEAVIDLTEKGAELITVILTGKEKICRSPFSKSCTGRECEFAEGYYDKVKIILDRLEEIRFFDRKSLNELADEYKICPFELSLDLGLRADILVADYNHLFDPVVSLKRFFNRPEERYTALIDEAHNLPDRGRDMFTAHLSKKGILDLKRVLKEECPQIGSSLMKSLGGLNRSLLDWFKRCEETDERVVACEELDKDLIHRVSRFNQLAEGVLREELPEEAHFQLISFYLNSRFFVKLSELYDSPFRMVYRAYGKRECQATILCLDPAPLLKEGFERCQSTILFSATLSPMEYFKQVLIKSEKAVNQIEMESPFDPKNCPVQIRTDINTRYRGREESLQRLVQAIADGAALSGGNHLVFFPSYRYLEMAAELWETTYPDRPLHIQTGGMSEEERAAYLSRFEESLSEESSLLAFAVMGGIFGEGVDLPGDLLKGVTIVGVGLPGIGVERNLLKEYYNGSAMNGYDFAYRLPGWNRVLQATGRVIRKGSDKGIIQLLDDRFGQSGYRRLFPRHWFLMG